MLRSSAAAGPHHARLECRGCGCHRGWLSGGTFRFLSGVIDNFGRPTEPIESVTTNSRKSADPPAATQPRGKSHAHRRALSQPLSTLRRPQRPAHARHHRGPQSEDIGGESKVVLSFTNGTKALILNKTNGKAIAKAARRRDRRLARQGHNPRPGPGRLPRRHRRRHPSPRPGITALGARQ